MKIEKFISALTITAIAAAPSFATASSGNDNYVGIQYDSMNYDESGINTLNLGAVVGRIGYFITDNIAIEARAGAGVAKDKINIPAVGEVSLKLDRLIGIYGVGQFSFSERGSIYGLVGYSSARATKEVVNLGVTSSTTDSSASFGIGVQYDAGKNYYYSAEYTQYLQGGDYDLSAASVGLSVRF